MIRFLAPRLARAVLTILLVVTFAFVGLRLTGDPALLIMGDDAPPDAVAAFRAAWGLDAPLWQQYVTYGAAVARGDLGLSMRDGRPAMALVAERVPATLALMLPALALKLGLGLTAGIAAALNRGRFVDRVLSTLAVLGFAVPSFVLGLILMLVFAVELRWFPSGGQGTWRHAVLPVLTLGFGGAAILARLTRSAMLDVLGQPYIRAARARGFHGVGSSAATPCPTRRFRSSRWAASWSDRCWPDPSWSRASSPGRVSDGSSSCRWPAAISRSYKVFCC